MKAIALLLVAVGLVPIAPEDGRQFRQGYRDGFSHGLEAARTDCAKPARAQTFEVTDYTRGYALGFDRGFDSGVLEHCV